MRTLTISMGVALATTAMPAMAQQTYNPVVKLNTPVKIETARRTSFNPEVHGFNFVNTFQNDAVPQLDIRTGGLCGGMVYSALDYFNARMPVPQRDFEPATGTTLHGWLYRRQINSMVPNLDKWAELSVNPFGRRNAEFYRWGLEMSQPGHRINELRREIDAGRPVPLGLRSCDEGCKGDHQVLAIGYDMNGYDGNPTGNKAQLFRIFVYDPNHPNETRTLHADPAKRQFRYAENGNYRWRTWFVDTNYSAQRPPVITNAPSYILAEFLTGGDDLRGGNDNVHLVAVLRNGRELRFNNVNKSRRWIDHDWEKVELPLPAGTSSADVRAIRIETTFGGGGGGDNWNLNELKVHTRGTSDDRTLVQSKGDPLIRFTGDRKTRTFTVR